MGPTTDELRQTYEIHYSRGRFSFYVHSNVREKQKEKEKEHVPFPFPFPFRGAIFGCEKAVLYVLLWAHCGSRRNLEISLSVFDQN